MPSTEYFHPALHDKCKILYCQTSGQDIANKSGKEMTAGVGQEERMRERRTGEKGVLCTSSTSTVCDWRSVQELQSDGACCLPKLSSINGHGHSRDRRKSKKFHVEVNQQSGVDNSIVQQHGHVQSCRPPIIHYPQKVQRVQGCQCPTRSSGGSPAGDPCQALEVK